MSDTASPYTMRISRLTIDKLGIKLYDKVAAVLAELIANAYDADAEHVRVSLPLNTYLASRSDGKVTDLGYEIGIQDDGHGMTRDEVNEYYLWVGTDRRRRGDVTPVKGRPVMGRKGIGKLAPFGICREMEVLTAGGAPDAEGNYAVSNLILRYEDMVKHETEGNYHPEPGPLDGTKQKQHGTTITLRNFDRRQVQPKEDLHRQLAARFGIGESDWSVKVVDCLGKQEPFTVGDLPVDKLEGTEIDVSTKPVFLPDGTTLSVTGWMAYAKQAYKNPEMAGVRIYARGKLVAQTRDFEVGTGFTGEFKVRSYIVGVIHAEWLDDTEDDLIRSDRQDIIWSSERGQALQQWGSELIKELAKSAETSLAKKSWEEFLETSKLDARLMAISPKDAGFRDNVKRVAKLFIGRTEREAIRKDPEYVESIVNLALAIGPHYDLVDSLRSVAGAALEGMDAVLALFDKARLAEIYSLGQVARERVDVVNQLRRLLSTKDTDEMQLQKLIERAPWLLYPDWTPLSNNQSLARVRKSFATWFEREMGREITTSAIENPTKRPDFVMLNNEGVLEIVEIKDPGHALTDEELRRADGYLRTVLNFLAKNPEFQEHFTGVKLTVVCNYFALKDPIYQDKMQTLKHKTWDEVLAGTLRAHENFIGVVDQLQGLLAEAAATAPPPEEL